jgi:hypothetical protein
MNIILKAFEEILGYSDTSQSRTDPSMGYGEVVFFQNSSDSMVEKLFRERSFKCRSDWKARRSKNENASGQLEVV